MARPSHILSPLDGDPPLKSAVSVRGPVLSKRDEWLAQLRVNDIVAVYFGKTLMGNEAVTSAPRTFVTTGKSARKVSYRRSDGYMAGKGVMVHWFHIEEPT